MYAPARAIRFGKASATTPPYRPESGRRDEGGDSDEGELQRGAAIASDGHERAEGERLLAGFGEETRDEQVLETGIAGNGWLGEEEPEEAEDLPLRAVDHPICLSSRHGDDAEAPPDSAAEAARAFVHAVSVVCRCAEVNAS